VEVSTVKISNSIKPFPSIFPACCRFPCPRAIAASGAPPPATMDENAEIRIIIEPATPMPASAGVPIPGICPI